jgi:hypothetical protein
VNDVVLTNSNLTTFFPAVSLGMFYTQNGRRDEDRKFWISLSMLQAISGNVEVLGAAAQRERQLHFGIGTRRYGYDSYLEPYFTVNLVQPEVIDMMFGARYEVEERFWAGLGYSTVNDLSLQGGWIIPDISGRYTSLRLGVIGNIALTQDVGEFGPGFEFIMAYTYDVD